MFQNNVPINIRSNIQEAINWLSTNTPFTFAPKGPSNPDYVQFTLSDVNNSYIGRVGNMQTINLTSRSSDRIAIHEIMHACGIFHEMGRSDRDDFVTINTANIKPKRMNNFNKISALSSVDVGLFDPRSTMMYFATTGDTTFAYDTLQPIIFPNNSSVFIAPSNRPTATDLLGINMLYGNEKPYLHITTEIIDVYDDFFNGSFEKDLIYTFSLYSDANKTRPYIKPYRVPIILQSDYYQVYAGVAQNPQLKKVVFEIPFNSNSVSVSTRWLEDREYGNLRFQERTELYGMVNSTHYYRLLNYLPHLQF